MAKVALDAQRRGDELHRRNQLVSPSHLHVLGLLARSFAGRSGWRGLSMGRLRVKAGNGAGEKQYGNSSHVQGESRPLSGRDLCLFLQAPSPTS